MCKIYFEIKQETNHVYAKLLNELLNAIVNKEPENMSLIYFRFPLETKQQNNKATAKQQLSKLKPQIIILQSLSPFLQR